ncbi:MAG: hypothetical protein IJK02_08260 [Clostridia bacterium]|nr:hypothetical protein [Clostridia bacterium]
MKTKKLLAVLLAALLTLLCLPFAGSAKVSPADDISAPANQIDMVFNFYTAFLNYQELFPDGTLYFYFNLDDDDLPEAIFLDYETCLFWVYDYQAGYSENYSFRCLGDYWNMYDVGDLLYEYTYVDEEGADLSTIRIKDGKLVFTPYSPTDGSYQDAWLEFYDTSEGFRFPDLNDTQKLILHKMMGLCRNVRISSDDIAVTAADMDRDGIPELIVRDTPIVAGDMADIVSTYSFYRFQNGDFEKVGSAKKKQSYAGIPVEYRAPDGDGLIWTEGNKQGLWLIQNGKLKETVFSGPIEDPEDLPLLSFMGSDVFFSDELFRLPLENQLASSLWDYEPGDVIADMAVGADDARFILRASVGLEDISPLFTAHADVDHDGSVSAADARLVLRASVGLEQLDFSPRHFIGQFVSDNEGEVHNIIRSFSSNGVDYSVDIFLMRPRMHLDAKGKLNKDGTMTITARETYFTASGQPTKYSLRYDPNSGSLILKVTANPGEYMKTGETFTFYRAFSAR